MKKDSAVVKFIQRTRHYPVVMLLERSSFGLIAYSSNSSARFIQGIFLAQHGEDAAAAMALVRVIIDLMEPACVKVAVAGAMDLAGLQSEATLSDFGLSYQAGKYNVIASSIPPVLFLTLGGQNLILYLAGIKKELLPIIQTYFYTFGPGLLPIMLTFAEKQVLWVLSPKKGCVVDVSYAVVDTLSSLLFNYLLGIPGIGLGAALSTFPIIGGLELFYRRKHSMYRDYYHMFDRRKFKESVKKTVKMMPQGATFFLQSFVNSLSTVVGRILIGRVGTSDELIAVGISSCVNGFGEGAGETMAYATMVLFKMAWNEGKPWLAQRYYLYGNALSLMVPTGILITTQIFPNILSRLFVDLDDPAYALVPAAVQRVCLVEGITQFTDNIRCVSSYLGRASNDTLYVTLANIIPMTLNISAMLALVFTGNLNTNTVLWLQFGESALSSLLIFSKGIVKNYMKGREAPENRQKHKSSWIPSFFRRHRKSGYEQLNDPHEENIKPESLC
jgi:Na+-driven multidrug efflux pump